MTVILKPGDAGGYEIYNGAAEPHRLATPGAAAELVRLLCEQENSATFEYDAGKIKLVMEAASFAVKLDGVAAPMAAFSTAAAGNSADSSQTTVLEASLMKLQEMNLRPSEPTRCPVSQIAPDDFAWHVAHQLKDYNFRIVHPTEVPVTGSGLVLLRRSNKPHSERYLGAYFIDRQFPDWIHEKDCAGLFAYHAPLAEVLPLLKQTALDQIQAYWTAAWKRRYMV